MVSNSSFTHLKASTSASDHSLVCSRKMFLRIRYSFRVHAEKKFPKHSLGDKWKLNDINTILLIVPFKYVLSFLLFDLFSRELELRRDMVKTFLSFLRYRWQAVPAAPVEVLPFESEGSLSGSLPKLREGQAESQRTQSRNKSR